MTKSSSGYALKGYFSGFFSDLTASNLKVPFFSKAAAGVTATQSSVSCCETVLRLKTFISLSNLHTYVFLQVSPAK